MAKDSAFLKKVYDKYLDEDFAYGVSNLNPKREISKGSIDDAKTIEQQVIEEIEKDVVYFTNMGFDHLAEKFNLSSQEIR